VARESKKKMGEDEAEKFMHNHCKGMIFRFIVDCCTKKVYEIEHGMGGFGTLCRP